MDSRARWIFLAVTIGALVPLLGLWWWSVDPLVELFRAPSEWFARLVLPVEALHPDGTGGWKASTTLPIAGRSQEIATFAVSAGILRRMSAVFPFFLALCAAPPRPKNLAATLAIGIAGLAVLYVLSTAGIMFCMIAVIVNHHASEAASTMALPPYQVAYPPYGDVAFMLAGLGYYLALGVLPLLSPMAIWLALNPRMRAVIPGLGEPAAEPG